VRVALFHNLGPGGALRVVEQQVLLRAPDIEYDLFEPEESQRRRAGAAVGTQLAAAVRQHILIPRLSPARGARLAPSLEAMRRHDRLQRGAAERIDAGRYDLVMAHPDARTYTPWLLAHLRTPTVYFMQEPARSLHDPDQRRERRPLLSSSPRASLQEIDARVAERLHRGRDRRAATAPSVALLCNSQFSAAEIERAYGVTPQVVRLGVDPAVFTPGEQEREPAVLAVGGLEAAKRHDLAVRALASIPSQRRPALHVVYERVAGDAETELAALARSLDVRLHLHRAIDDTELAALYRNARCTLVVARGEPFGLSVLESLASGTPVVAVREGGPAEVVVEGRTGTFVDATPVGIASGIERIMAAPGDFRPAALHAEIESGEWRWRDCVLRIEGVMRDVAASSPNPSI
jgi:glycosyltransferase involved in cell wall biosynthesis